MFSKPPILTDLYLIGLDIIIDQQKNIKILEIQNAYECDINFTYRLTKLCPIDYLLSKVKARFPTTSIEAPAIENINPDKDIMSIMTAHANKASTYKGKTVMVNRGIEAMLLMKWLFYNFCHHHANLRHYIPQTFISTLETLSVNFKEDPSKKYLFKPSDSTKGTGIMELPKVDSMAALKFKLINNSFLTRETKWRHVKPLVIQEYLTDENKNSQTVMRVYAAVAISPSADNKSRLEVFIDTQSATQHKRINQNPNDFTLKNNSHGPCKIDTITDKIDSFLKDLFNTLLMQQSKINYREWEVLAKKYIKHHQDMNVEERKSLLCLFFLRLITRTALY